MHVVSLGANCEQMGVNYYYKHHQGIQAKSDGVNVSEGNDKTGLLVTMSVQRLCSLEDNSFEIELEQDRFWRTTSNEQLPRGLIRDCA